MLMRNFLISQKEEVSKERITGDEVVLKEPIFELAFKRILKRFKPRSKIALFSLCTSTRPYSKSYKWNLLIKKFGKEVDLVICSNGGIIPIEYQYCYPFMQYDAPHLKAKNQKEIDKLYVDTMVRRMKLFLSKFKYDLVLLNFLSSQRNYRGGEIILKWYKQDVKKDAVIVPGKELELMIPMRTTFQKFNRAVSKVSLDRMTEIIKEFKNGTGNISGKI